MALSCPFNPRGRAASTIRVFRQKSVFVLLHTILKNAKVHTNLKHRRKKEKEKENVYNIMLNLLYVNVKFYIDIKFNLLYVYNFYIA